MAQILLLSIKNFIILEFVLVDAKNLVLDLCLLHLSFRLALVIKFALFEAVTVHYFGHFVGLFVPGFKFVASPFGV